MPSCLTCNRRHCGAGLIEVMVALLLFATAMTGLLAAQLEIKKVTEEALQRSLAVLLAGDALERVRGNPGLVQHYATAIIGDEANRVPAPEHDCAVAECSPEQLARYDLWHWESLLLGSSGESRAGGLPHPRACIVHRNGTLTVSLNWLGASSPVLAPETVCDLLSQGLYDDAARPPGNQRRRRVLTVSTSLGGTAP